MGVGASQKFCLRPLHGAVQLLLLLMQPRIPLVFCANHFSSWVDLSAFAFEPEMINENFQSLTQSKLKETRVLALNSVFQSVISQMFPKVITSYNKTELAVQSYVAVYEPECQKGRGAKRAGRPKEATFR